MVALNAWLRAGQPLEPLLAHYPRWFDAWEAIGVRGLVVGRLTFRPDLLDTPEAVAAAPATGGRDGERAVAVDAVTPDPGVYRRWAVPLPAPPAAELPGRRRRLHEMLAAACRRGWPVYVFEPAGLAGRSAELTASLTLDDTRQRAYLARLEDTLGQFPEAEGAIMDGPEWGYEIDPEHRSYLFGDLPPAFAAAVAGHGYDYDRMVRACDRLHRRLHSLTPGLVEACSGGAFGAWELLDGNPDLAAWLAFRSETLLRWFGRVRDTAGQLSRTWGRPVRLGLGVRLPSLASICGHNLPELGALLDLLLPKLYVWNRGVDGLYGTVRGYVRTLQQWNPGLSERHSFVATGALLGLRLPAAELGAPDRTPGPFPLGKGSHDLRRGVPNMVSGALAMERLLDLELGFPPAFFTEVVAEEARRALAAVGGDASRVVPWVDAGLRPHGGDPVTTGDLYRLLAAAAGAGVRHFVYHGGGQLAGAEAAVLGALCGGAATVGT